ncbi:MAG: M20/M25/M40 family metallo-hydrolase [Candidatus Ancillula sp.]|jgi:acetylornithine deacetylase/succinyl-diaminopimelate desuccinylase-like protein|nr:M20/M25/M40 family metallo-hydrolase [Candidatus Ancillula sp.]
MVDNLIADAVFNSSVEALREFVSIPFVSNLNNFDPELMNRSVEFVGANFSKLGFKVEIVNAEREDGSPGNKALIGTLGAGQNGEIDPMKKTVLLYAHHDVQPVQAPENWVTEPFSATVYGQRMYGRGAADDGAGIVAHLGAVRNFRENNEQLPVNVKVFIEGEEEIGSPSFANFLKAYREKLQADVIIVADSGNWAVGVPSITTSLRGVATIRLELQVLKHDVHSGMSSGPILDANLLLMKTLSTIHNATGEVVVPGLLGAFGNRIPEPLVDYTDDEFRRDNGILEGVELAGSGTITGRVWVKPSVCVIGFDAVPTAKSSNVLASKSAAVLSLRVVPGQDPDEAANALIEYLKSQVPFGAKLDAILEESGPAFQADVNSFAAVAFKDALEESFGAGVVYSGMGGSIPFTADLKKVFPEAEVLISGVEDPDSRAHSDNESVHLGDLRKVIGAEYLLLKKIGVNNE